MRARLLKPFGYPLTGFVSRWNYPDFTRSIVKRLFFVILCLNHTLNNSCKTFYY